MIIIFIIGISGLMLGFVIEKILWNRGICKKTGKPWVFFSCDSQGGRGYKSEENVLWISYPFIDSRKNIK